MKKPASRATHRRGSLTRRVTGMALVGALAVTAGCTALEPAAESVTRALQSVVVELAPNGEIVSLNGTTVLLDQVTGEISSRTAAHGVAESVDELPVRVTTRYRTDEGAGVDLSELAGHTGRVEIELTLENLLVSPENVTYDVVGESRTTPALIGTPLSIAASAAMPGTSPGSLVLDQNAKQRTNGVVSRAANGSSVVQWGTLLAPPQSKATAAFRLVADVKDFVVPSFDIAIQAGLHTDLGFAGTLGSALSTGSGAELAMQRKAIGLVGDVNDVLTRAGGTITAVRKNLDDTSGRLGARALQTLSASATRLPAEMSALTAQLTALDARLSGSLTASSAAMKTELAGIVHSMSALFGDTRATPGSPLDGSGCAATMKDEAGDGTVFSMFVHLSALLDGYADASEGCRDEILKEVDAVVGPDEPDETVCGASARPSATCALFQTRQTVVTTLAELVESGRAIVDGLDTAALDQAQGAQTTLMGTLGELDTAVSKLGASANDRKFWTELLASVAAAQNAATRLGAVRDALSVAGAQLSEGQGTAREQQETIAAMLCELLDSGDVSDAARVEGIRAQIVGVRCDGILPQSAADVPAGGTSLDRLAGVAVAIDAAVTALDAGRGGTPLFDLDHALASLHAVIAGTLDSIDKGSSSPQQSSAELRRLVAEAAVAGAIIGEKLETAQSEKATLASRITEAFEDASDRSAGAVAAGVEEQTSALNAQRRTTHDELSASYRSLIDGLRSSSGGALEDGRRLIDGHKDGLAQSMREASTSLDRRTTDALAGIERTISASVRDVDGASALLADSLNSVLLDLGDPTRSGLGILGAMSSSAALTGTADFQLAQASQHASSYANVREEDIAGILLRVAQFQMALERTAALPAFGADIPHGVTSQTIYSFTLGGSRK